MTRDELAAELAALERLARAIAGASVSADWQYALRVIEHRRRALEAAIAGVADGDPAVAAAARWMAEATVH